MSKGISKADAGKPILRFREDGTFRILLVSDLQETPDSLDKCLQGILALIEKEQPDLLAFGGDIAGFEDPELLGPYLDKLLLPLEERKLPWIHVFGNHDHDVKLDGIEHTKRYESYPHCLSGHQSGISGATNYMVPVYAAQGEGIAWALWGLDTNNTIENGDLPYEIQWKKFKRDGNCSVWDGIRFDQQMWYWNASVALEESQGRKIPGVAFLHVPLREFQFLVENQELTGTVGSTVENMDLSFYNTGFFATLLQRGDIRCVSAGHSHMDNFDGTFCGIRCCMSSTAGYSSYGIKELRGGRVFVLREGTDKVETYTTTYADLQQDQMHKN